MLDGEARARGTTVYLVDRRLDMLPGPLSEDAASLLAGVDRLAVSVLWRLSADLAVKNIWFGRSVIRCRASTMPLINICRNGAYATVTYTLPSPPACLSSTQVCHDVIACFDAKMPAFKCIHTSMSANSHSLPQLPSRSRYQLTYQHAQDVLDGRPPAPGHDVAAADRDTLRRALTALKRVTDHLRARRQAVCTCQELLAKCLLGM